MKQTRNNLDDSLWVKGTHQQLGGAQHVQVQALDPGVVDPHLPVDPRALDTDEHPEVGGQPGGTWRSRGRRFMKAMLLRYVWSPAGTSWDQVSRVLPFTSSALHEFWP